MVKDSSGVLKGFFAYLNWIPIFTFQKSQFWIIGMIDYQIIGVSLQKDEIEPAVFPKPLIKTYNIDVPFASIKIWWSEEKKMKKILQKRLIIEHEKYRNDNWMINKIIRNKNDPLFKYCSSIISKIEIIEKEKEIEKELIDIFRECVVKREFERSLLIAKDFLKNKECLEFCFQFFNKLNLGILAEKINTIIEVYNFFVFFLKF